VKETLNKILLVFFGSEMQYIFLQQRQHYRNSDCYHLNSAVQKYYFKCKTLKKDQLRNRCLQQTFLKLKNNKPMVDKLRLADMFCVALLAD